MHWTEGARILKCSSYVTEQPNINANAMPLGYLLFATTLALNLINLCWCWEIWEAKVFKSTFHISASRLSHFVTGMLVKC